MKVRQTGQCIDRSPARVHLYRCTTVCFITIEKFMKSENGIFLSRFTYLNREYEIIPKTTTSVLKFRYAVSTQIV